MKKHRPLIIFSLLTLLVLALTATSIYFYRKYNSVTLNSPASSQKEVEALVKEVGKIILLPQGEIPTIATVSDVEKLKGQAFFVDAKTGDKVLIYSDAKKAILYDPSAKKIVNVAPINIGADTPGTTSTPVLERKP